MHCDSSLLLRLKSTFHNKLFTHLIFRKLLTYAKVSYLIEQKVQKSETENYCLKENPQRFGILKFWFEPQHHGFLSVSSLMHFLTSMPLYFTNCTRGLMVPNFQCDVGNDCRPSVTLAHGGASQRIVWSPSQTVRAKEICLETYKWPYLPNGKLRRSLPSMSAFVVTARQNIQNSKCHCKAITRVHHVMRNVDVKRSSKHIYPLKIFYLTTFGVFTKIEAAN